MRAQNTSSLPGDFSSDASSEVGNLSSGSLAFATALTFFSPLQILKQLMYVLQDILALPNEGGIGTCQALLVDLTYSVHTEAPQK